MASASSAPAAVDTAPPIPHTEPAASSSDADADADAAPTTSCAWVSNQLPPGQCLRFLDCPSHAIPRPESSGANANATVYIISGASTESVPLVSSQSQPMSVNQPETSEPVSQPTQDSAVQPDGERLLEPGETAPVVAAEEPASDSASAAVADQAAAAPAENTPLLEPPHEITASATTQETTRPESEQSSRSEPVSQAAQSTQPIQSTPSLQLAPSDVMPSPEPELPPLPATSSSSEQPSPMSRRRVVPLWEPLNERPLTPQTTSRPLTPQTTSHPSRGMLSPEIQLPRWQPDAEATYCPICSSQFSIFVRKHHCRKCGRVVCNACSPHRIVIPYQYIVRPPGQTGPLWNEYDSSPTISGGERVRLCNPCVPDPNTAPPLPSPLPPPFSNQQYTPRHHQRSNSGRFFPSASGSGFGSGAGPGSGSDSASGSGARAGAGAGGSGSGAGPEGTRGRSATVHHTPRSITTTASGFGGGSGSPHASSYQPSGVLSSPRLYPSLLGRPITGQSSSSVSSSSNRYHHRSLPPPPPLAEEDECPVCHLELPSRLLPNFEGLREAHIAQCIMSHSAYRGTPPGGGSGTPNSGGPSVGRRTGMFQYLATEKDCVDSAECTICLEEFEVGEQMARLECLCRFHLRCIRAWFNKHPGRCPVHQHDSFGF